MKKQFQPGDLAEIAYVSELSVSPDGARAAFTRYRADTVKNAFVPAIFILDTATGEEKPLPAAGCRPLCTALGLYFLSDASGEAQVWRFDGETAAQMTRLRHGVTDFAVAQDGKIAVCTPLWPGEEAVFNAEMAADEKAAWREARAAAPVIADDFIYKLDSAYGLLDGSVSRLAIVEGRAARVVSAEGIKCAKPAFLPDGRVAYYGKPYAGFEAEISELFVWDGAENKKITDHMHVAAGAPPVYADGGVVFSAYKAHEGGGYSEWLYRAAEGAVAPLFSESAPEVCHGVNGPPIGRSFFGAEGAYVQAANGWLYFVSCWQGDARLFRMLPDGAGAAEPVETGGISVHSFAVRADGSVIFIGGDRENPADLYRFDGTLTRLTRSNGWLAERALAPVHRLKLPTGDTRMDVWVVEPENREEGKLYPAVLDIHGGPECCYTDDFWHEFRALSGAGLAVIYCNPRGGAGYGPKHTRDDDAYGEAAWNDFMATVDAAVALGFVDPARVGVTGGSYGGYMTVKLIAKSKRFRAAVGQRILCNTATSYGTGDMGFASARQSPDKVNIKDYLMKRTERSLIRWVDDIDAPLLLLHGYKDYRCGFEQSEQLFVALRERRPGVPARMVMFPDENHGVTRTGKPLAQIRHLTEMRDWFVKHLAEGGQAHG